RELQGTLEFLSLHEVAFHHGRLSSSGGSRSVGTHPGGLRIELQHEKAFTIVSEGTNGSGVGKDFSVVAGELDGYERVAGLGGLIEKLVRILAIFARPDAGKGCAQRQAGAEINLGHAIGVANRAHSVRDQESRPRRS